MTASPKHVSVACECGYDLTGLPIGRPCPECGRHRPSQASSSEVAPLAREPHAVTIACIWRQAIASIAMVPVGVAVFSIAFGGAFMHWSLSIVALPIAVSTFIRNSPRLVDPMIRGSRRPALNRFRIFSRIAAVLLAIAGSMAVAIVVANGPGVEAVTLLVGAFGLVVGVLGSLGTITLDDWAGEDRAESCHGLSAWIWLGCLIGIPLLVVVGNWVGYVGSSSVIDELFSLSDASLATGGLFVGVVGWWLVSMVGDVFLVFALVRCLLHRSHYNRIDERRREREMAERDEARHRLGLIDEAPEP